MATQDSGGCHFALELNHKFSAVDREAFCSLGKEILRINWVPRVEIQLQLYTVKGNCYRALELAHRKLT